MADISGFSGQIRIVASNTFPAGITIDQFADDIDPLDIPSIQVADKAMGLNGDLLVWAKASPIIITLGIIPDSEDDINLGILLESNRVGRGKISTADIITLTGFYPNGNTLIFQKGRITDGIPNSPIASAGRLKSKTYTFCFENKI